MLKKSLVLVTCLCAASYADVPEFNDNRAHSDVGLRVPALVTKYGYPLEVHTAITYDEYILTLHRIPHGKNNADLGPRPVVFLMHGLLCSSADWVLMGPEKGLAFLLADRGYDVWMGNARGNTYSRNHVRLNPDINQKKFWDFSWHDIGRNDLPTMIDYVLKETGEKQISYIGHSQGTTAFFVMASTRPVYTEKVKLMIAFAPVAYMNNIPNLALKLIAQFYEILDWITSMLGANEFLPSSKFMELIGQSLCNDQSIIQGMCSNILFLIAGFDSHQLNKTMLPVIFSNTPAGAATKQFVHYAQEIRSGKFREFDYNLKNIFKYGQIKPPKYDLSRVDVPVALLYGANDLLSSEKDIERLREELPRPILKYRIKHAKFNHLDFLWSNDIVTLLYDKVFDILGRF